MRTPNQHICTLSNISAAIAKFESACPSKELSFAHKLDTPSADGKAVSFGELIWCPDAAGFNDFDDDTLEDPENNLPILQSAALLRIKDGKDASFQDWITVFLAPAVEFSAHVEDSDVVSITDLDEFLVVLKRN